MINRRHFSTALAAGAAASMISPVVRAQTAAPRIPQCRAGARRLRRRVVLERCDRTPAGRRTACHGGAEPADLACRRRRCNATILALQDGPTVLVGHSFAGTIISEAGVDPKVAALVYVAARAPDAGEDYPALAARFPRPPASDGLVTSGGFAQLNEESFLKYFAGDVDPVKARILYAVQGRVSTSLFSGRTTVAAWRSKPSWYQVSANDKTISPELQRFMADRMKAKTIELRSSHVSLISHPQEIAALILEAASA
jgi:pimeloyl-ACP methyl ester carboxylesterase